MEISYENIISRENLYQSWKEFLKGKKKRKDVERFSLNLMDEIEQLHYELKNKTYSHGSYTHFRINDPKPRDIHKASVRDRLVHHAIYRVLYPYFDKKFIDHSYSCRKEKGTHRALFAFEKMARKVGKNHTKTVWVLKCDIRKFFASIDHTILREILKKHIQDEDVLWLLENVIDSFSQGLPLGNLTSQLLVNVYMNEFDQYIKHNLKAKNYIRYADDFVILSQNKSELTKIVRYIEPFLEHELKLKLHPNKVFIATFSSGVDFLGWVHFPNHRVLRKSTEKRMFRKVMDGSKHETIQSYLGMLGWGNGKKLQGKIKVFSDT